MRSIDAGEAFPDVIEADLLAVLPEQVTDPLKGWQELSRENSVIAYEIYRRAMDAADGDLELFGRIINSQVFLYQSLRAAFARRKLEPPTISEALAEPDSGSEHEPLPTLEHAA